MRILRFGAIVLGCTAFLAAAPAITGVYNAASWAPPSLPNSGIAQGSIFTLTGTGLGPSALVQVQSYPLPTTQGLAGTSIQITVGSVTTNCPMIYTVNTQVAAILPSATPVGSGTLTLTYQGAPASVSIKILAANLGTFTLNEAGSGPGVFTDLSYNPITYLNPAYPGQTLVLWGTGLGPITGNETEPPTQVNLNSGVQVFIGGQSATVLYGGRGSSPGLDQINFVVPSGVAPGCKTSVVVLVGGVTGNVTTIAIAPAGQATCGDTVGALTTANLQTLITRGSFNAGYVQLYRIGSESDDTLAAEFGNLPLNSVIRSYGGSFGPSIGSCAAYELTGSSIVITDPVQPNYFDPGPSLIAAAPSGSQTVSAISTGLFDASFPDFITQGTYTVQNGSGGANIGPFNWSVTLPAPIVPTNIPSTVDLSKDLTLTWTGGSAFPVVAIFVYNGLPNSAGSNSFVQIVCTAQASAGQFTVPAPVLNLLPPTGYGTFGVKGVSMQIAGFPLSTYFNIAGAPGLDFAVFSVFSSAGGIATVQ